MDGLTGRNDGWWFCGRKQRSRLGTPRIDSVVRVKFIEVKVERRETNAVYNNTYVKAKWI